MLSPNVDQILIKNKDYFLLYDWWRNIHEGDAIAFSPVLEEALIALAISPDFDKEKDFEEYTQFVHFKHTSDKIVVYNIFRDTGDENFTHLMTVERNYETFKFDCSFWNKKILRFALEELPKYVDSVTSIHPALMNYMEFYKEERERVVSTKHRVHRTKKTKNNKKKKNVRPLTTVVYQINPSTEKVTDQEKGKYKIMKESWSVRGHWRNLKNGNKIWIRPYVKGDKKKREPYVYRF